jgi:hypothetical protein
VIEFSVAVSEKVEPCGSALSVRELVSHEQVVWAGVGLLEEVDLAVEAVSRLLSLRQRSEMQSVNSVLRSNLQYTREQTSASIWFPFTSA